MLFTLLWGLVGLGMLGINRDEIRQEKLDPIDSYADLFDD
jgi:hypothetical protein